MSSLDADLQELELLRALDALVPWRPLPGPQQRAYDSPADIVGFGGAAGGGKTDLAVGLALTQHKKTLLLRREATQLTGVIDRVAEVIGSRDGFNGADRIWRLGGGKQIELGSVPNVDDWTKYQGRPHDLLVFDEASNFLESQVRALLGWLRTTEPGQRCRAVLAFNPPTSAEGRWIVKFFAPWLDDKHPQPAQPGELRWFATIDGAELEVPSAEPFNHNGEKVTPLSRTFIASRVTDNPHLLNTGYVATLQALPEPLRSQMLHGDFTAGMEDDPWQVIPTAWVDGAMRRWSALPAKPPMDGLGVDVARGGKDNTVIARRHGAWFDEPLAYPGTQTPDGPTCAGLAVAAMRDGAPIHIDVIGVGAAPFDFLRTANLQVIGVNVSERATNSDKSGRLRFSNQRAELWWAMREALDPANNSGIALPPDQRLRADLCAPTWKLHGSLISVESREDIHKRIGRSPDWASAYILGLIDTPKVMNIPRARRVVPEYDPIAAACLEMQRGAVPFEHNPYGSIQ